MSKPPVCRIHAVVCMVVAALALGVPAGALGGEAHYYARSFGTAGSGAGQLALAEASLNRPGSQIAVNEASHDVYIADTGNRRVDEFEANGVFVRAFGWGVLDGEAKLETCTLPSVCRAGLSGAGPGEFETPEVVAVDNDPGSASHGDVYVGDRGDSLITKFTAGGALVEAWGNNGSGGSANGQLNGSPTELFAVSPLISGIVVDGSGNLLAFTGNQQVSHFSEAGAWQQSCRVVISTDPVGLAVDGAGYLYLGGSLRSVEKLEPDCARVGDVAPEHSSGIALDGSAGDLYVGHAEGGYGGMLIEDIRLAECVPGPYPCVASQLFGEGVLAGASGLAVDPGSGVVYAVNTLAGSIAVFDVAVAATPSPASAVTAHGAVLHGTVNPEGVELSRCSFEYGEGEAFDHSVPCEESVASIGAGSSPVEVRAGVVGLVGGSGYEYRLRATNADGDVRSELQPLTTATVAKILEASSGGLEMEAAGGVSVSLSAKVNPEGIADTTCEIQYGTTTGYGSTVPCEPAALSGSQDVAVSVRLHGLDRATEYHWRVLVMDANGGAEGADQTFVYLTETPVQRGCANEAVRGESDVNPSTRRAFSLALPDCRAYEMVTPPAKNGALLNEGGFLTPPSFAEDGSRVLMKSIQCFDATPSCVGIRQTEGEPYQFERTAEGWVIQPLAPPVAGISGNTMVSFNADTGLVLYALPAVAPALEQFYVRQPGGVLRAVGPIGEAPGSMGIIYVASRSRIATSDFSHIVYSAQTLWPSFDETTGGEALYEYGGYGQQRPALVGVTGGAGSTSLISRCGTLLGGGNSGSLFGSLSDDGLTVYFTAADCASGSGVNAGVAVPAFELYARIGESRTIAVSASAPEPQCDTVCQHAPPGDAFFTGASADGSRVFFTDTRQLANSASEDRHQGDSAHNGCQNTIAVATGCNLYEFECPNHCENEAEKRLVDVSAPADGTQAPRVQGVLGLSADGSHVYFVAKGVLTVGPNPEGKEPLEGAENLYVYERDGEHPGGRLEFIATLSGADDYQFQGLGQLSYANVSPDGRFLVFTSHRALTPDVTHREGPAQVYRYDAQSGRLLRVSIGEQGFADNGNDAVGDASIAKAMSSYGETLSRADPTMSDDGSFVFFQSPTGLTPGALNDHPVVGDPHAFAENVYEWEAQGRGGCELAEGCVSLISDGRDLNEGAKRPSAVRLLYVDATGANVFFQTADQLVPADTDTQLDVYDARVNGGFPAPVAPAPCEAGEVPVEGVCRGAGSSAGVFAPPGSVLPGLGNTASEAGTLGVAPGKRGVSRAERLARALGVCRRRYRTHRAHRERLVCEAQARRRYGPAPGGSGRRRGADKGKDGRRG